MPFLYAVLFTLTFILLLCNEKAGDLLPEPDLDLHLDYCGDGRLATLDAHSAKGTLWITTLAPSLQK